MGVPQLFLPGESEGGDLVTSKYARENAYSLNPAEARSFTFKPPRDDEQRYYIFPPNPPYRHWLKGDRLIELQAHRDKGGQLSDVDFLEYKRLRGREDFFYFAKYIAGFTWLEYPLHGPIAYAWSAPNGTRVGAGGGHHGQVYGHFRLGVIPRAHLKTSLMTQAYAMWRLVRNPEERILIYTSTFDFAGVIMNYIRTTFEGGGYHGTTFLQCYGDSIPRSQDRSKWTTNDITINRQGAYSDPSIKARGIGSRVVGGHHTLQLIDDLVVEELNKTMMDKVIRELDGLDPLYHSLAHGERRYVGTPWAFFDPIVYIRRNWKDACVVCIPWKDVTGKPVFTYEQADLASGDPVGTSLREHTAKAEGLKRRNAWFFSCQYECYPQSEEGLGFRKHWFKYFRMAAQKFVELDRDESPTGREVAIAACNTFLLIDPNVIDPPGSRTNMNTNVEIRKKGDFAAWVVVCVSPDNYWYIPRVIQKRCNLDWFTNKTHELVATWKPLFVAIEQVAAQRLFYHIFQREFRAGKPKFQIVPWQGGHASKPMRIKGLIPYYSNGFIHHRVADQPEITEGMAALEGQLLDGEGAEYDDIADALSAAVPLVYPPGKHKPTELDTALAALSKEARWANLDPISRGEAQYWERRKRKGVVTGDKLLIGDYANESYEDPMAGLVEEHVLEMFDDV